MNTPLKTSLSAKLMLPVILISLLIIGVIDVIVIKGSEQLFESYVEMQSTEYIESFLIATEVSSDKANIIRVTNSIGAYSDVKELFIIDTKLDRIIAANKGRYIEKPVSALPELYLASDMQSALAVKGKYYQQASQNRYIVGYRTSIASEDKLAFRTINIVMLIEPESINAFFDTFQNKILLASIVILVASLFIFYGLIRRILLLPLQTIILTLNRQKRTVTPVLCDLETDDELGVLSNAYNTMLLERYDKRQELVDKNEELKRLILRDALTGVSNRAHFDKKLSLEWLRAMRSEEALTLIFIDIDHFKHFNDAYGHLEGDECLRRVAQALKGCIKRSADFIGRFGGEEFVILLPGPNDHIEVFAETCRQTIANMPVLKDHDGNDVNVTISLGVATMIPQRGEDANKMIKAADTALYQAKAQGRNRTVFYQSDKAKREAAK